ncbi:hypothetical protein B6S12_03945 [Helicobacter valdiviensis]|uniref:Uncharacterized protein n=1 Tax=Helicobacter valdiviensis TaxID=1458358 RepID=A0A2W6MWZ7_9HELI|nr:hypothetical protein [Helicobacter valdiviensis]PZT48489.1 hypothetical protein B6S12_03945 [Helicobacter valdiviensis]
MYLEFFFVLILIVLLIASAFYTKSKEQRALSREIRELQQENAKQREEIRELLTKYTQLCIYVTSQRQER